MVARSTLVCPLSVPQTLITFPVTCIPAEHMPKIAREWESVKFSFDYLQWLVLFQRQAEVHQLEIKRELFP